MPESGNCIISFRCLSLNWWLCLVFDTVNIPVTLSEEFYFYLMKENYTTLSLQRPLGKETQ